MSLYTGAVFIHVAAAIALVSSSVIISPRLRAAIGHARTMCEMRLYVSFGRPLQMLEPVSAIFVLLTGIYLTSVANFWAQGWVQVAVVCWLLNAAIASMFVNPLLGRLAATAETAADGSIPPALDIVRRSSRWAAAGDALMANDAAMVWLMTMKPELVASLLVVALSNVAVALLRQSRRGSRRRVAAEASSA